MTAVAGAALALRAGASATSWRCSSSSSSRMIAGTFLHPAFLTQVNLVNILQQSSELSVLVLAEAIILIVGRFDLSLESIVGVAPMFAAWLVLDTALNGVGPDARTPISRSSCSSPSASRSAPSTAC